MKVRNRKKTVRYSGAESRAQGENDMQEGHYAFFQNRECEYFPCHEGVAEEEFNCLFCYCPLYTLGENCGGAFNYTENGIKSCIGCAFPHIRGNFSAVTARFQELACLAEKGEHHGV